MRLNRAFPPVKLQQPPVPEPPSRLVLLRRRLGRIYTRFQSIVFIMAGILIALSAVYLYDMTRPPPQRLTQRDINAAVARALASATPAPYYASQVYEIIRPSLVRVETLVQNQQGKMESALGTGVVIDDSGTILTSLHVIKNAREIRVIFADKSESEASVLALQPENDLAVLHPEEIPDDLIPATLASAAMLHVGDEVVAVGNPFGITNSLTAGVVSGLGRNFKSPRTGETLTDLIQFDAAVNSGNSGGPLLNRDGEVVGIITALFNPTDLEVFIGIGFAVPIETATGGMGSPPY